MALLCYVAKLDPFLSLDCVPRPPPRRNPRKEWDQIAIWQPWLSIKGFFGNSKPVSRLGEQVFQCLENGVSQVPKLEGRFPQVNKNTEIAALKVSLVIALTPSPLYYLHNVSLLLLGWNPAARPAVRLGYLHSL